MYKKFNLSFTLGCPDCIRWFRFIYMLKEGEIKKSGKYLPKPSNALF